MALPGTSTGMMDQHTADTNLRALMDIQDINTITSAANGLLGKQDASGNNLDEKTLRERRIEYFYDKVFLDTIKLGTENNVYLKYCKAKEVPAGHAKIFMRRWAGLTEHTVPLTEGVPPKSDYMRTESFEGTFNQYGRYMEFSDRVEFNLIDPVISMMTAEYGDLAVRTAERLCREAMIATAQPVYANAKTFDKLVIGDTVGIADYRLMALKLKRLLVKPINGVYAVICSPEHIYDLVQDPLVVAYMTYTHTAEPYKTGKPVDLFNIRFEETMMDDFGYGYEEMANPGAFSTFAGSTETYKLRIYTIVDGVQYYYNATHNADTANFRQVADKVLNNGSLIPNKVTWDINSATGIRALFVANFVGITDSNGDAVTVTEALSAKLIAAKWFQLPVHRSFLFGEEHMIKTGISGRGGAKMYVKAKGSAGVLDPIDQRQSIGFKIDTLGFTRVRDEALQMFIFVPTTAHITQQYNIEHAQVWTETFKS